MLTRADDGSAVGGYTNSLFRWGKDESNRLDQKEEIRDSHLYGVLGKVLTSYPERISDPGLWHEYLVNIRNALPTWLVYRHYMKPRIWYHSGSQVGCRFTA